MRRILVTGARGNVGREVVRALRSAGVVVRAADRASGPMKERFENDVERVPLDFSDPRSFEAAVTGCDAVFLLRPPAISDMKATLNPFIDKARAHGVDQVVFLSVAGAAGNKLVPHHAVEVHLAARGGRWTILRPGFFAQNLGDAYRRDIVDDHRLYVPAGRGRVAFVDVRDVADVAVQALVDPDRHKGRGYTLTGPEAITFGDVAALLSEYLGRDIKYVPAAVIGYLHHLHRRGLPTMQVVVQTVLHTMLRFGQAQQVDPTLADLLGRAPRTVRDYVKDHLALWSPAP